VVPVKGRRFWRLAATDAVVMFVAAFGLLWLTEPRMPVDAAETALLAAGVSMGVGLVGVVIHVVLRQRCRSKRLLP
jgi:hypothetical protein